MKKRRVKFSYPKVLAGGFALIILIGAALLTLPISSKSGTFTAPLDALFTATSATAVTGLIVYDTYEHWSAFGQCVILGLIQIGGLGFMTFISLIVMMLRKKISLRDRLLMMQSSGNLQLEGVTDLIAKIVKGTAFFELLGALVLSIRFCPKYGFWRGIYNAIFHSVSAFCNAGFDLMGKEEAFSSFSTYVSDPLVCITLMMLIIIGGIGFLIWDDISRHGIHLKKYALHSKITLTTTAILVFGGWLIFFCSEYNAALAPYSTGTKILASAFQSVTTRTAGFNTIDQAALSRPGSIVTMILMLIGGSPSSTAGGIKTTTIAVVFLSALAVIKSSYTVEVHKRQLNFGVIRQAFCILIIYITVSLSAATLLCCIEPFATSRIFFEVFSAVGTVGITTGITTMLSPLGKTIILLLMFFGRIGGLSLVLAFTGQRTQAPMERPEENILIG